MVRREVYIARQAIGCPRASELQYGFNALGGVGQIFVSQYRDALIFNLRRLRPLF